MATEWRLGQGTLCQSRRPHLGARYWQGLSFPAGQIVSEEVPLETSGVLLGAFVTLLSAPAWYIHGEMGFSGKVWRIFTAAPQNPWVTPASPSADGFLSSQDKRASAKRWLGHWEGHRQPLVHPSFTCLSQGLESVCTSQMKPLRLRHEKKHRPQNSAANIQNKVQVFLSPGLMFSVCLGIFLLKVQRYLVWFTHFSNQPIHWVKKTKNKKQIPVFFELKQGPEMWFSTSQNVTNTQFWEE